MNPIPPPDMPPSIQNPQNFFPNLFVLNAVETVAFKQRFETVCRAFLRLESGHQPVEKHLNHVI